jgi:hypothetical protein
MTGVKYSTLTKNTKPVKQSACDLCRKGCNFVDDANFSEVYKCETCENKYHMMCAWLQGFKFDLK